MTRSHRLVKKGVIGRPKKAFPLRYNENLRVGGIPMKVVNGRIQYKYNLNKRNLTTYFPNKMSQEEVERLDAPLPQGEGDIIRKSIYELRFGIEDETDKERRKREYEEWWKDVE